MWTNIHVLRSTGAKRCQNLLNLLPGSRMKGKSLYEQKKVQILK